MARSRVTFTFTLPGNSKGNLYPHYENSEQGVIRCRRRMPYIEFLKVSSQHHVLAFLLYFWISKPLIMQPLEQQFMYKRSNHAASCI